MAFTLEPEALARLFPAHILIDHDGRILRFGPAVGHNIPAMQVGDLLTDHCGIVNSVGEPGFLALARHSGRIVQLRARETGVVLTGAIVAGGPRILLAMHLSPVSLALADESPTDMAATRRQITDYSPGDPSVDVLLLVSMQKAMLEEARTMAMSLARERQRSDGLLDRVSRVAGYLAHDFNNMLSIIRLNAQRLLGYGALGAAETRLVQMIAETAERGSGITRSLMTLSRERNDSPTRLSPDAVIELHVPYFATCAGGEVTLKTDLQATGAMVLAPNAALVNCLINLVLNARDAMVGKGEIVIATRVLSAGEGIGPEQLQISVTDTGKGMDQAVLTRVFEPFFSTKAQGNGIGLPSVRDFARTLGGEARLESHENVGTRVEVTIPVVAQEMPGTAASLCPASSSQADAPLPAPRLKCGRHVLLVEDEPYALEAVTEMLEWEGFHVIPACDDASARAALAVQLAAGHPPDILLTDILLPDGNGTDLAAFVESQVPGVGVALMSGFVPQTSQIRDKWQFIPKPLNPEHLLSAVRALPPRMAEV